MGMVTPDKFGGLTAEEIDREVRERREMIGRMVGRLYPAILSGEIGELLRLRWGAKARPAPPEDARRRTDDNLRRVFG
jgi:hypothetical protein